MNARKLRRYYAEAAVIVTAVTASMAAPWIVADTAEGPAGTLLLGFTAFMAGSSLTMGTVALAQIVRAARLAARR